MRTMCLKIYFIIYLLYIFLPFSRKYLNIALEFLKKCIKLQLITKNYEERTNILIGVIKSSHKYY